MTKLLGGVPRLAQWLAQYRLVGATACLADYRLRGGGGAAADCAVGCGATWGAGDCAGVEYYFVGDHLYFCDLLLLRAAGVCGRWRDAAISAPLLISRPNFPIDTD